MRPSDAPKASGSPTGQRAGWTPGKERAGGPIRSGPLVFLGGIGGWYPERRPEGPGDARRQFTDALDIMSNSLRRAGSSMASVLQVQVSLVDPPGNYEAIEQIFMESFPEPRPSLAWFGIAGFRREGQLLQVDCIAAVD